MSGARLIVTAARDLRDDDGGGADQLGASRPRRRRSHPYSWAPQGPGDPHRYPAIPPLQTSFSDSDPAAEQYRELCSASDMSLGNYTGDLGGAAPPAYPAFYTRVTAGTPGGRSTLHAVLDYDDDDPIPKGQAAPYPLPSTQYSSGGPYPYQGPRGPVVVKNDSVAVVPLYSYGPTLNSNGSFVHIPVLWSALSIALGLEIRGDIIRGTPCIKRHHQLFCPTAGNKYPLEDIELFIDENKALIRRMYGEFETSTEYGPPGQEVYESDRAKRRADGGGGRVASAGFSYDTRERRQAFPGNTTADDGKVDACQSKVEIVTPYWAANSAGKIRAVVNTQHFEQAIHQEVCSKVQTNRCNADCGCEQKYKWHRLLAYDPDNDCKGIFMDWFLFPSCCVCRCNPLGSGNRSQQQSSNSRHRS